MTPAEFSEIEDGRRDITGPIEAIEITAGLFSIERKVSYVLALGTEVAIAEGAAPQDGPVIRIWTEEADGR